MILKYVVIAFAAGSLSIAGFAQTPEAKKPGERAPRVFSWTVGGDSSYLGIEAEEVTRENFARFGLSGVRGVAIEKVIEGSPAAAAGLQAGDVIVRVNGDEVTSVRKLTRLLSEIAPDHSAKIVFLRSGNERDVTATLGKRPMPKFESGNFEFKMPAITVAPDLPRGEMPQVRVFPRTPGAQGEGFTWSFGGGRQIGVGLTPLTKQLAEHFGVDGGALITNVREDSPAAKAGLKAGDIIIEVDGKAIKGDFSVGRAISEKKEGPVTLTIVRDRNRQTISVTPEPMKGGFELLEAPEGVLAPGRLELAVPPMPSSPAMPPMPAMPAPAPMNHLLVPGRVL
jgi:serine protease Do